jgi:hypothetical protein
MMPRASTRFSAKKKRNDPPISQMVPDSESRAFMNTSPLTALLALCLLGCLTALLAGAVVLGLVFAAAGIGCCGCMRQHAVWAATPLRPVITYLPQPVPHEPLIRLQRGQFVTVPWPHTLQVLLPEGVHLQILEATSERVRIMAV